MQRIMYLWPDLYITLERMKYLISYGFSFNLFLFLLLCVKGKEEKKRLSTYLITVSALCIRRVTILFWYLFYGWMIGQKAWCRFYLSLHYIQLTLKTTVCCKRKKEKIVFASFVKRVYTFFFIFIFNILKMDVWRKSTRGACIWIYVLHLINIRKNYVCYKTKKERHFFHIYVQNPMNRISR